MNVQTKYLRYTFSKVYVFCFRVQREQLAAIFQLLRDKQDTFGEVTESDLQEQLKLYSIWQTSSKDCTERRTGMSVVYVDLVKLLAIFIDLNTFYASVQVNTCRK